ncbi:MAG: POTRA domain-containing protein, partial [Candidatus Latescibacterota bacterium]
GRKYSQPNLSSFKGACHTRTRIGQLKIIGAAQIPIDTLRAHLAQTKGKVFRPRQLARDLSTIQRLYAERGMIMPASAIKR